MSPSSLSTIWEDTGCRLKFRVRNVRTLNDYLILKINTWTVSVRSKPESLYAYAFQTKSTVYLECLKKEYVLLSTRKELDYTSKWKGEALIPLIKEMYKRFDYCSFEKGCYGWKILSTLWWVNGWVFLSKM